MLAVDGGLKIGRRRGLRGVEVKRGDMVRIFTTTVDDELLQELVNAIPRFYEVRIKHETLGIELSIEY